MHGRRIHQQIRAFDGGKAPNLLPSRDASERWDTYERQELRELAVVQAAPVVLDREATLEKLIGENAQQVRLGEANYLIRFHADDEVQLANAIVIVNGDGSARQGIFYSCRVSDSITI